jgi:hypothetical protein
MKSGNQIDWHVIVNDLMYFDFTMSNISLEIGRWGLRYKGQPNDDNGYIKVNLRSLLDKALDEA